MRGLAADVSWADAEGVCECGCVVIISYGEIDMRACSPEHRRAGRRAARRFRTEQLRLPRGFAFEHDPPAAQAQARRVALDRIVTLWDEESAKPEREIWFRPRYWVAIREASFKHPSDAARREPCCDCGEPTIVYYDGSCAALIAPLTFICNVCSQGRRREDGPGWRNVRRPAKGLD